MTATASARHDEPESLLRMRGITRAFGKDEILKGVDLDVPRGSVTALLGRNGSGKSTLMRIAVGLIARDGGDAEVFGVDPEDLGPTELGRLAWLTDTWAVGAMTSVQAERELVSRLRYETWNEAICEDLFKRFSIPSGKLIRELSKGQQTRLRLALTLASQPELLLLDEPALGLDLFGRQDLLELMIDAVGNENRAVLLTSHLIDDVERVADRLIFLRQGEVVAAGTIDDLRDKFRRVRLDLSSANFDELNKIELGFPGLRELRREPGSPDCERVAIFDDFSDELMQEFVERSSAHFVEARKMSVRDIFLEVLRGESEEEAR